MFDVKVKLCRCCECCGRKKEYYGEIHSATVCGTNATLPKNWKNVIVSRNRYYQVLCDCCYKQLKEDDE